MSTQFNCQKHLFQVIQIHQSVLIQAIQFSMSEILVYTQLNAKTDLFQVI